MTQYVLWPLGKSGNSPGTVELVNALQRTCFEGKAAQAVTVKNGAQLGPVASGRRRIFQFSSDIALRLDKI
jgi:hypothetical protein